MLGLRNRQGVNLKDLKKLGYDLTQNEFYKDYLQQDIIRENQDVVNLNSVYYHLSNTIISNLLP